MTLVIKRWNEADKQGYSGWYLRLEDHSPVRFPSKKVIQRIFSEVCPRALYPPEVPKRLERYIILRMQVGLTKKDRQAFLLALQNKMGI